MNEKNPKAAIITVYYNREDHIKDSINSLVSQTYPNLDIIVIDDCSTDNTYEKLKKFDGIDPRIKIYRNQNNKGFTQTLIDTIDGLKVKYVAIHGAGDISMPTRVEEQVNYLEANQNVGVVSVDIANMEKRSFNEKEITLKHLLKKNRIKHGSVMFQIEAYHTAGGYRSYFTTRQDKDLWYRMSLVTKIHFYPKKLYRLVDIEKSVSKTASYSGIPTALSEFSKSLIMERISTGTDALEKYGEKGALLFNPTMANGIYLKNYLLSVYKKNNSVAQNWLNILIKINRNAIFFKIMKLLG